MSEKEMRSLNGPGTVVGSSSSLALRFLAAGFELPDQKQMDRLMRATAAGIPWSEADSDFSEDKSTPFWTYTLDEYATVQPGTLGAPVPIAAERHIKAVQARFPEVEVRIHAHKNCDPFIELIDGHESLFSLAWNRTIGGPLEYYPPQKTFED